MAAEQKLRARREGREHVLRTKWDQACADCGGEFPAVAMDFDHRPSETKRGSICKMVRDGYSLHTLQEEIDKCDLVCANCHRVRTARRRRLDPDHVVGELR